MDKLETARERAEKLRRRADAAINLGALAAEEFERLAREAEREALARR